MAPDRIKSNSLERARIRRRTNRPLAQPTMAIPVVALTTFGVYAYVMYWYSVPGAGFLPEGKVDVPAWIGDLSLALPATATVLYLSMCYFGPKVMAKR